MPSYLCDTCAILMLLPIVPQMFRDADFDCLTTLSIRQEFRTTPKFKDKYPWRQDLGGNIRTIPASHEMNVEAKRYEKTIDNLITEAVINERTGCFLDPSKEDIDLLAWALALESQIISGDDEINDLGNQEFRDTFKGMIFPLEALNNWVEQESIEWNDTQQEGLEEWNRNEERPQPETEKARFERLTGYSYVGS